MKIKIRSLSGKTATVAVFLLFTVINPVLAGDLQANKHVVEIRNLEFIPGELKVAPGDMITWINYDLIPHTVTADDESWDSGLIKANGKWEIVVQKDTFPAYFCRFHPTMKAKLDIVPAK